MEVDREHPPAYSTHDPSAAAPPALTARSHELPPIQVLPQAATSTSTMALTDRTLPPLLPTFSPALRQQQERPHSQRQSLDSKTSRRTSDGSELSSISPPDNSSSLYTAREALTPASVAVSMDDPDVRLAAEALSGLGNPDFFRSPSLPLVQSPTTLAHIKSHPTNGQEPEPLLNLISENHPWLGSAVNGSLSAYTSTKQYTPRFIQSGAAYIENTAASVGRRTGVEGSLRRYLGARKSSEMDKGGAEGDIMDSASKRRRVMSDPGDHEDRPMPSPALPLDSVRRFSQHSMADSLPAYDDSERSPVYEEKAPAPASSQHDSTHPAESSRSGSNANRSWSTQLVLSTTGLGAALSDRSLTSLRYCLGMLKQSIGQVNALTRALKILLDDYEKAERMHHQALLNEKKTDPTTDARILQHQQRQEQTQEQAEKLAANIKAVNDTIWQTLKTVCQNVSRYTGGALPEHARQLVTNQLMSVPRRWQVAAASAAAGDRSNANGANGSQPGVDDTSRAAHRMLAFAREGIDMMTQVNEILDGVVVNAEKWLVTFGRGRSDGAPAGAHGATQPSAEGVVPPMSAPLPAPVDAQTMEVEQPPTQQVQQH